MGQVHAEIEIINSGDLEMVKRHLMDQDEVRRMHLTALVDTGTNLLCINENIQAILNLPFVKKERKILANGEIIICDVVGPVEVRFKNEIAGCNAVVLPGNNEPLLGLIPMEEMDVSVHPVRHELVVNTRLPITGFWASRRGKLIYT
jgi:clan AA aspartic protease